MQPEGTLFIEQGGVPPAEDVRLRAGNKAFNLLKLSALGLPVPPGFVLPTTMCKNWVERERLSPAEFRAAFAGTIERLERDSGLRFGDFRRPLLVSVRSGAPVSMPGMLDTVLNVGLTTGTIQGFIALTGNPRLAWDCFRRLVESYAVSVHGIEAARFENLTAAALSSAGAPSLAGLDTLSLRELACRAHDLVFEVTGTRFPDDPYVQLLSAIDAVFRSWNSDRARSYRRINALNNLPGTSVTVQRMVFGNAGASSGAGVGFTRDPSTGEKRLYIDFVFDAQGEDVVSGRKRISSDTELRDVLPDVAAEIETMAARLERVFGYAQDFEFTVAEGRLYLLQTRDAKCSDWARLKIVVDMVEEGVLAPSAARMRLEGLDADKLTRTHVLRAEKPIAMGMAAGMGVATGAVALSVAQARAAAESGRSTVLVRNDIATEDIEGIAVAKGILTARGGRTSHAAVVARDMGKVAVVGCEDLQIGPGEDSCVLGGRNLGPGAEITLDGETGAIYAGAVEVISEKPDSLLAKMNSWQ